MLTKKEQMLLISMLENDSRITAIENQEVYSSKAFYESMSKLIDLRLVISRIHSRDVRKRVYQLTDFGFTFALILSGNVNKIKGFSVWV